MKGDGQTVVRGGYGRFYDKTHYELITGDHHRGRLLGLLHRELPRERRRPRSLAGPSAHEPLPGERTDGEPPAAERPVPARHQDQEHGDGVPRQPRPRDPVHRPVHGRLRAGAVPQLLARHRLRPRAAGAASSCRSRRTRACGSTPRAPAPSCASIPTSPPRCSSRVNVGEIDYDALLVRLRAALGEQLPLPRLVHARQVAREHLAATASPRATSSSSTT